MSKLLNIEGIEEEHLEVFEAVGIGELVDLASSDPSGLHSELLEANEMLALVDEVPEFSVLEGWVEKARKEVPQAVLDSLESTGEEPMMEEFVEVEDEGAIDGESVLVAQALSRQDLKAEGIKVSEIPEAIYISEDKLTESRKTEQGFKTMGESLSVGRLAKRRVQPLERKARSKVNAVNSETNKGVSRSSKRFIKGVLHKMPWRVRVSAIVLLTIPFVLLLGVLSMATVFIGIYPEGKEGIGIAGFVAAPIIAIILLLFSARAKCQVCGQKQFFPKNTRKNKKAHHVPLLGYMIPTAVQALLFHWFHCIYCGTAIRLKE